MSDYCPCPELLFNRHCQFFSKKKLCAIYGKWTECLYAIDPAAFEAHRKADKKSAEEKKTKQVLPGDAVPFSG